MNHQHEPDPLGQIRSAAESIRSSETLTAEARDRIRGSLVAFVRENPVCVGNEPRALHWPGVASPWYREALFVAVRPVLAAFLIAVVAGGSASYAAEAALPGDDLYWVKTEVNEEVADIVAVTMAAQVSWDARKVERRLEEATALAASNRLDAEAQAEIESRVEESLTEFARSVSGVRDISPDVAHSASADFEAALRAHQSVLARFEVAEDEKGAETDVAAVAFSRRAQAAADNVATVRVALEAEAEAKESYFQTAADAKSAAAKRKVAQAREALGHMHESANVNSSLEAEASATLAQAARAFADGDAAVAKGDYQSAFAMYQTAHALAAEAKLLVNAGPLALGASSGAKAKGTSTESGSSASAKSADQPDEDEETDRADEQSKADGGDGATSAGAKVNVGATKAEANTGGVKIDADAAIEAATSLF